MTRKTLIAVAALAALSTLTACDFFGGPSLRGVGFEEPEVVPDEQPDEQIDDEAGFRVNESAFRAASMATLAANDSWELVITLLDMGGNDRGTIETGIESWGEATFALADDGFLVQTGYDVYAVSWEGVVSHITSLDASYVWRIEEGPDGEIAISEEEEMEEVDEDGDVIYTVTDYDACFMDVDYAADGTVTAVNTYGPDVVSWDRDTGAVSTLFTYAPESWGVDVLGIDGDGMVWVGEEYGARLHVQSIDDPSASVSLGSLNDLGVASAWTINGVERATGDSVFVLYEGYNGSGIVEVDRDGNVAPLVETDAVWLDLVRL